MGRNGKNDHSKSMLLRFPPGLRERLDASLEKGEDRTGVIQGLITTEVERREAAVNDEPDLRQKKGAEG